MNRESGRSVNPQHNDEPEKGIVVDMLRRGLKIVPAWLLISLLIWGLAAAWLVHPFQEPMTYAATLFAGGFVWGGLLCVLWYRRFCERNDFALVG